MSMSYDEAFPPERFVKIENVPLLDEHEIKKDGKNVKVTAKDLEQTAANNNARWENTHDATAICVGHTSDDDSGRAEIDGPPLVGWAVNFRVEPFFETGRQALYADFYIRKDKATVIEDFPRRSVEYWPNRREVDPIALLGATTPERDLSVLKFGRSDDNAYRYSVNTPNQSQSPTQEKPMSQMKYDADDKKDEKPESVTEPKPEAKKDAKEASSSSYKGLEAKIDALMQMFQDFLSMLTESGGDVDKDGDHDGDEDDLLQPVDKEMPKGQDKEARKDMEKPPVKFEGATSTNCYVPGTEEPKKMSRTNDEAVSKYERKVQELETARQKDARRIEELEKAARYARAEKAMADLEKTEHIDFGDEAARKKELDLMASLKDDVFPIHLERAKTYYKRKTPAVDAVSEALRYSRTEAETTELGSREEVNKVANLVTIHGMSYEDALKKVKGR